MREILFRAKAINRKPNCEYRTDYKNGDWVYGLVSKLYDEDFYEKFPHSYAEMTNEDGVSGIDIDYKTIGQYTGLTDKNGVKIFEGDILSIAQKCDSVGRYFDPPIKYPANVVVKWDLCAWMWEVILQEKFYLHFPDAWCHYQCENVGNVHDNPELIGGESDAENKN